MTNDKKKKKFSFNRREYATIAIIVLIFIASIIYKPEIFSGERLVELISSIILWLPLIVSVAMGMLLVIVLGDIDISVGSIIALAGMAIGFLWRDYNIPLVLAVVIAAAIGLVCGLFNGFLISYIGIPSMIVTLATMNIYRGLAMIIGDSIQIYTHELPTTLNGLVVGKFLGIPWLTWIAVVIAVAMFFIVKYTHFGVNVYAIGGNKEAAHMRGINTKMTRMIVFTVVGLLCGLAAFMYGSRYMLYHAQGTAKGFEFIVISATVIGGVSMKGGSGTVVGTVLGAFLLGSIQTLIPMMGLSGYYYNMVYGLIIIIALIIDRVLEARSMKAQLKEGR